MPCPPEQVLRWKTMLLPLLIARQSSWFMIVLQWTRISQKQIELLSSDQTHLS